MVVIMVYTFHSQEGERQGGGRPVHPFDGWPLRVSDGERLVGIEVLGASRLFDTPESPKIDLEDLIPRIVPA
jgi:hypothetical protein